MKILSLATKEKPRSAMKLIESGTISSEKGLNNDARGRAGNRQVTILSAQQWAIACEELDTSLPWTLRRANILIDDYQFDASSVGKIVKIGDVQLRITEETDPCHRMDEQHAGLTKSLQPDWRGGVCCKVLQGGEIRIGDTVTII